MVRFMHLAVFVYIKYTSDMASLHLMYSAIPWNGDISNALMSLTSGKEMRFQVPPKTFWLDSRAVG